MATSIRVRVLLVTSLLLGTASVHAEPVTFQERTSGDLPELLPAPASFVFDVGVNRITGTLAYLPFREFDRDSFAFTVPAGTEVTAITYSFLTTFRPGVVVTQSAFFLGRGTLPLEGVYHLVNARCCDTTPTASTAFLGALPLGAGIYGLENFGLGFTFLGGTPGEGFSQQYTWSFHVGEASAPVPEPASLLAIALGLALVAAMSPIRPGRAQRPAHEGDDQGTDDGAP
jgi:hypothetical protein